jgi:predicted HicB family RNase H-like nuclease
MTLQIRNVPATVHKALKQQALDQDVSLNTLVVRIITASAKEVERAARKK